MIDKKPFPKSIITELDSGNTGNLGDFIEYVYSACRHNSEEYEEKILQVYNFKNTFYNDALIWIHSICLVNILLLIVSGIIYWMLLFTGSGNTFRV